MAGDPVQVHALVTDPRLDSLKPLGTIRKYACGDVARTADVYAVALHPVHVLMETCEPDRVLVKSDDDARLCGPKQTASTAHSASTYAFEDLDFMGSQGAAHAYAAHATPPSQSRQVANRTTTTAASVHAAKEPLRALLVADLESVP